MAPVLYYTPTSCGAANFITAYTAGLKDIKTFQVDTGKHVLKADGKDFYAINPKGNVPCLVLDDGTVLNENAAVLQYLADLKPEAKLAPPNGTSGRYLLQTALSYVSSEVHTAIGGLFNPQVTGTPVLLDFQKSKIARVLTYLNTHALANKKYLVGETFTVADAYLYLVLSWSPHLGVDLTPYPNVSAFFERIKGLPNVQAAHARMAVGEFGPATIL